MFLGERFRRLASRPGGGGRKKAGCAVGRSILVIVWHLLNDRAARYRDLAPARAARPQKIKGISIFVDCWYSG